MDMPADCRRAFSDRQTIARRLDQYLPPRYIQSMTKAGPVRAYVSVFDVVNIANDIFGFDGWSCSILSVELNFCDHNKAKDNYTTMATARVRITLKDGTFREDIGHGDSPGAKDKIGAIGLAEKDAVAGAMKRALKLFGNALGNCTRDEKYAKEAAKKGSGPDIKRGPEAFYRPGEATDQASYRPPQVAISIPPQPRFDQTKATPSKLPLPTELEMDDEFGGDLEFDNLDMEPAMTEVNAERPASIASPGKSEGFRGQNQFPAQAGVRSPIMPLHINGQRARLYEANNSTPPRDGKSPSDARNTIGVDQEPAAVGFTAAPRPAQGENVKPPPFNPKAGTLAALQSGAIDHSKSGKVTRDEVASRRTGQSPAASFHGAAPIMEGPARQIGRPGVTGMGTTMQNRGNFRAPMKQGNGLKRDSESIGNTDYGQMKRQALAIKPQ
ncbi:MAG: DNA repair protein rad52 [Vezdaea aestivalis]|nr:MAG: DNA repair protein rad52 [Vezdaea aestivalis]